MHGVYVTAPQLLEHANITDASAEHLDGGSLGSAGVVTSCVTEPPGVFTEHFTGLLHDDIEVALLLHGAED